MNKCPGQDSRELTASTHPCPNCGAKVEMFSDEQRRRCPGCRGMVFREHVPTCAAWCQAAEECLGPERYARAMEALGLADQDEQEESTS